MYYGISTNGDKYETMMPTIINSPQLLLKCAMWTITSHDIYKEGILCKQKLDARTKITYDQCQNNDNNKGKTNNVKMYKQKKCYMN
jgi:hypothetical protein